MHKPIIIKLGTSTARIMQIKFYQRKLEKEIQAIRKSFLQEFGKFPPSIIFQVDEKIASLSYAFDMEGWANVYYFLETSEMVYEESEKLNERIFFYLRRFVRKWYVNCIDIMIEDKLKDQPIVLEYGESLVDIIEDEIFYETIQELKTNLSLSDFEWNFWESDYVEKEELVVYVYGRDYYIKNTFANLTKEKSIREIISQVLLPILDENKEMLQVQQ